MGDTPINERQQYWLDHIRAAEKFEGSIADYARSEGLTPKERYSRKGIVARRGLFRSTFAQHSAEFVRVIAPAGPLGMSLVLPNGVRLDWHGDPPPEQLETLLLSASRLP